MKKFAFSTELSVDTPKPICSSVDPTNNLVNRYDEQYDSSSPPLS